MERVVTFRVYEDNYDVSHPLAYLDIGREGGGGGWGAGGYSCQPNSSRKV